MKAEPEVYASSMGEDSSTLYVPVDHYPTPLGALRAVNRSLWFTEATNDGWQYRRSGEIEVETHPHGPDDARYDPDSGAAICHPEKRRCHVFEVTG